MADNKFQKEFTTFLSDRGFVYGPEPELYGGLSGFYTYGPLGKSVKNKVENIIRKLFTFEGFWEVECPTVLPKEVWQASGHLNNFNDPVVLCSKCKASFRADKLIEEKLEIDAAHFDDERLLKTIVEKNIKCLSCGSSFNQKIERHSLMMKTTIGTTQEAYNRPETATATYLPFQRYLHFFRSKVPFGVFQIGKAYRNEISPRQHILRLREFTQAEAQFFIFENQKENFEKFEKYKNLEIPIWTAKMQEAEEKPRRMKLGEALDFKLLQSKAYSWTLGMAYNLFEEFGIPKENIRLREHADHERAFYAKEAWDIELHTKSFGWVEVCGIHDRTNYDLTTHAKHSNTKLVARNEEQEEVPHVLEIAFGSDRPVFVLLESYYSHRSEDENKKLLSLPIHMSPIQVAIFPLVNKEGIKEKAKEIYKMLNSRFNAFFDYSGAIGRRYVRQDQIGTAFCVTVDYDSMQNNDVTLRFRDTMEQRRIKTDELINELEKLFGEALK